MFLSDLWGQAAHQGRHMLASFGNSPSPNQASMATQKETTAQWVSQGSDAIAMLQRFGAAQVQSRGLKLQAQAEAGAAQTEFANADIAATAAVNRYLDVTGRNNVAAAASGIDIGSGSVGAVQNKARDELASYRNGLAENAVAAARVRHARAAGLRAEAQRIKALGWLNLFTDVAGNVMKATGAVVGGGG